MAEAGGAQEAATPGRAACDAFWAAIGAGPSGEQPPDAAWNWAHEANARHAWEAAAEAANRAGLAKVLAERARYKAERDAAREEVERWRARHEALAVRLDEAGVQLITAHVGAEDLREQLATCRERNAAIAVQLDQYRDERDRYGAALERLADPEPLADPRDGPGEDRTARIAHARAALEATP